MSPTLIWFLIKAAAVALIIGAIAYGVHRYNEHCREEGRAEVRLNELAPLQAKYDAALKREAAIALLWNDTRIAAEKAIDEGDKQRAENAKLLAAQVAALPPTVAAVPFDARALRVLNDAISGQPKPTRPAVEVDATAPAAPADSNGSTVGLVTAWGVEVVGMYDVCRSRVAGWIDFSAALQAAQPKELAP